jgi:predicted DNA-binding WGR domain protein
MKQLIEQLQLKKTAGLLKENEDRAYSEAQWHMDKFMDDNASFDEYYSLIQAKDVDGLVEFLENNVQSEERMMQYFPEGGTIEEFAKHLINN